MASYALTGTPGTGKTSVAAELGERGFDVVDLNAHIRERGLLGSRDEVRDTTEVDVDLLRESLEGVKNRETVVLEGHLSHFLGCDRIVVLRCHPDVLASRLRARGYGEGKVLENVRAEILDVIFSESMETGAPVYEIDTTSVDAAGAADAMEGVITGKGNRVAGNLVDWFGEMEKWF